MMAYMNRRALALSLSTGLMHYWSRSRRKIWMTGAEKTIDMDDSEDDERHCEEEPAE
jgi:phosphoribosyl-AMP cyclohydrolase